MATKGQIVDPAFGINGVIVESGGKVYSCALNQTDLVNNSNKFYIMQLLKNDNQYITCYKWGRIGDPGAITKKIYSTESQGINAFEKQFKAKTSNVFGTKNFVKKDGSYFMSDVSYEDELKNIPDSSKTIAIPDSKLHVDVQNLIKMLSDVNMMKNALISLDIDTKKMPLGKIKKTQLDKADEILNKLRQTLADVQLNTTNADKLKELESTMVKLSSDYYTYLPMAFGRKKPPVINSDELIQKYKDVIEELNHMVVNVQITENVKTGENPIDAIYNDIHTTINPLDKDGLMWREIEKFVKNTHGPTHDSDLEILNIFEIEQEGKKQKFDAYCKNIGNRTLLYHGSGISNWNSIMKNDLLLNPQLVNKNVVISGKMFGDGIYLSNCITKSFSYCRAHTTSGIGCLALAEVPLGNISKKIDAEYDITLDTLKKSGHDSVQGIGKHTPRDVTQVDNLVIPNGKLAKINTNASLLYDEFIVYNSNQQLLKYLIVVKNKNFQ